MPKWNVVDAKNMSEAADALEQQAATIERLTAENADLRSAVESGRQMLAMVTAERERCKGLVRRYMPAGWSAVYDAMADEGPTAWTR
jgi:hypothetical protein